MGYKEELKKIMNENVYEVFINKIEYIRPSKKDDFIKLIYENKEKVKAVLSSIRGEAQEDFIWAIGNIGYHCEIRDYRPRPEKARGFIELMYKGKEIFSIMDEEAQKEFVRDISFIVMNRSLNEVEELFEIILTNKGKLEEMLSKRNQSNFIRDIFLNCIDNSPWNESINKIKNYLRR